MMTEKQYDNDNRPLPSVSQKTQVCQGDGAHGRVFGVLQGIPDPLTIFKQIDYVDVNGDYSSDIFL